MSYHNMYEETGETPYGFVRAAGSRAPRLVVGTPKRHRAEWECEIILDGLAIGRMEGATEPEACSAAQAYVDELKAHFRSGGE